MPCKAARLDLLDIFDLKMLQKFCTKTGEPLWPGKVLA